MKKFKHKNKEKSSKINEEDLEEVVKNPKIEFLSKISELKNNATSSLLQNDYDNAIKYSEKIIRMAIKHNMDNEIIEQQNFMKNIAEKVQRDYFLSEINETAEKIQRIYTILIDSNNFTQAHEILETFLNNYKDKVDVTQLSPIKALITSDKKEWVKHQLDQ